MRNDILWLWLGIRGNLDGMGARGKKVGDEILVTWHKSVIYTERKLGRAIVHLMIYVFV
jgi:hypothetical protein